MTALIVLAAVVVVLLLIGQIRLGGRISYGEDGFGAEVFVGPARIKLFPADKAKEKDRKRKSPPKEPKKDDSGERPGTVGRVLELLPAISEAAGGVKRRIRIDHLTLTVIWGAEDAASAAIGYGRANALLGMIWPMIDNNFKVKEWDFRADVDYGREEPALTADAAISMTVGQLISFALHHGVKILMNWSRSGKRSAKQQEA